MTTGVIGLDIGSSAVRAVQVAPGRGPATLERLGQVLLPVGAVRDGEIVEPAAVADALKALWSRYGFKTRKVLLGMANQQVVVRQLDLPYLPDAEMRQSLPYQVQDAIPIQVEQAILDFHTLEVYETEEGQRFSRILLVAAHRQTVQSVIDVVRKAKLEPVGVDLNAFAVLRSLAPGNETDPYEGELLIDVGASVTNVVVHEAGVPRFVRILLMGGAAITDDLMSSLNLPYEEAEQVKATTGVSDGYSVGAERGSRVITERANRFVDEIRGSLDYYRAQADAIPVGRIVLSGGASQLPNLRERIADTMRLPVDRGHPMQSLKIGKLGLTSDQLVEAEPYLAVAVGLALGAVA
ncbi:MAG: type IV pilus assembly protein PilM [Egibacteraceae bacterium]